MRKRTSVFDVLFFLIISTFIDWSGYAFDSPFLSIGLSYAQPSEHRYRRRGNRNEGIVEPRQLVAGERLVLISASIENNEEPPKEVSEYSLAFYLETDSRVNVVVRELDKLYKMQPVQRKFTAGICRFSWPSEIPNFYEIGLKDLLPLAESRGSGGKKIVPVVIFSSDSVKAGSSYHFCFIPRHAVSTLEYKIYRVKSLEPVYSSQLRELKADKKTCVPWNGKGHNNEPMTDGWYTLVVEATFSALPGTSARKVTSKYEFYHHASFFKKNE